MINETTKTREGELDPFRVMLHTEYLTKPAQEFERNRSRHVLEQEKNKWGYDPNNLAGIDSLETDLGRKVILDNGKDPNDWISGLTILLNAECVHYGTRGVYRSDFRPPMDLVISGETYEDVKILREKARDTRFIIARYSGYYGTGNLENLGFSLDIPKKVEIVKNLITYEPFINAIVSRKSEAVKKALASFNRNLEKPILTTPYLEWILEK